MHSNTHLDEKQFLCPYDNCGKRLSRKTSLKAHILNVHRGIKSFKCDYEGCGKMFSDKRNLSVHFRTHSKLKPYVCEECGARFSSIGNKKDHERRHLNIRQVFPIDYVVIDLINATNALNNISDETNCFAIKFLQIANRISRRRMV